MKLGLDIGSTTIKYIVLDDNFNILQKNYERHYSKIKNKILEVLKNINELFPDQKMEIAITGSAGMGFAQNLDIPFVQEVFATKIAANKFKPDTDVIIELGGEDAKILFLSNGLEVRMNGTCAGGTGAFIDQMATLLKIPVEEINDLAENFEKIYPIASRCGVFAKTDIQPLLNQGANKNDIAKSIFEAVVSQTISGLAQGRKISGKVLYLGGPLTFMPELRKSFDCNLKLNGTCPENSLFYVALGAATCANKIYKLNELINKIENFSTSTISSNIKPLFENDSEYKEFLNRHKKNSILKGNINTYKGDVFLGIDAGSTTLKIVVIGKNSELLYSLYTQNSGDTFLLVKDFLEKFYKDFPNLKIRSSAVTGYGEELIKNAFNIDFGIVETVAHLIAAKKFMPSVDFIIDIGGQDIKCFKVHNGNIDNIFLNEACSSGCGSFLQTFANTLGYKIDEFSKLALFAKHPVDLGSRCTVFMNSSVKQAQKDGATIEDISAGLSISVIKNAIYKVIRAATPEELGKNIVVQGGTFLNDAVLRAFELEMNTNVVRPDISGLMGAFGAALYAKEKNLNESSIVKKDNLKDLIHDVKSVTCNGCSNNCKLNINQFSKSQKFISGNRCEKPISNKVSGDSLNIYSFKLNLLKKYSNFKGTRSETIGLPLALNMYELLPFCHTFFSKLGFNIKVSPFSDVNIFNLGCQTIPSDTVCFPAKLVHGHIQYLINSKVESIFYPCMSYNINENLGDNHYNCPVVAYYPEVITPNIKDLKKLNFICAYVGLHRRHEFSKKIHKILLKYFDNISAQEIKSAADSAFAELYKFKNEIKQKGKEIIKKASKENKEIIVLAGRPYHVDPLINHGIDKLIASFNVAIISEDVISGETAPQKLNVLNQWTYHSRLYSAAQYILNKKNMQLIQLVSFGCGIDAITTDEIRDILESNGKIYTQLKIDEITNLGAIKIRLRSLLAAIEKKR